MEVSYQILSESQISLSLFRHFNRRQEISRCWRKEDGGWVLKNIAFIEDWGKAQYEFLVKCLKNTVHTGGFVMGAFIEGRLVGFASVENQRFGSRKEYVQLSCIHVSCENRGKGIGRELFCFASDKAKKLGAEKLYISAHCAEETQAFYHARGCVEAREYNMELAKAQPCDCQLECLL